MEHSEIPLRSGVLDQRAVPEQAVQQHGDLVRGPVRVGGDPPVLDDLVPVEHAQHRVGVPDVNRQQHGTPGSAGCCRSAGWCRPARPPGAGPGPRSPRRPPRTCPGPPAPGSPARSGGSAVVRQDLARGLEDRSRPGLAPRSWPARSARGQQQRGPPLGRRQEPVPAGDRQPVGVAHGGHAAISTPRSKSAAIRRTSASCCASFSPKTATSGRTSWSSLTTTVSTPAKCPGRDSPSRIRPTGPGSTVTSWGRGYIWAARRREHQVRPPPRPR